MGDDKSHRHEDDRSYTKTVNSPNYSKDEEEEDEEEEEERSTGKFDENDSKSADHVDKYSSKLKRGSDRDDSNEEIENKEKRRNTRNEEEEDDGRRGKQRDTKSKQSERRGRRSHQDEEESVDSSSSESSAEERRRRRRKRKHQRDKKDRRSRKDRRREREHRRRKDRRREDICSSSSDSSSSDSENQGRGGIDSRGRGDKISAKLAAKLKARGETLEERKQRRAAKAEQKRAAYIATRFGYTAEDNPFHDPNLHQAFTWKKKEESQRVSSKKKPEETSTATLEEIEKLRQRRKQRELQLEEMERIRREESRMKELENFDDWARKEEYFHLEQQRQRSAIRLVQGREKPIDVLAKNMLLFGVDRDNKAAVKYRERYNALDELQENLEMEVGEPFRLLHMLKQHELEEVLVDIEDFLTLEREAALGNPEDSRAGRVENPILTYWLALKTVALDELKFLKSGGEQGSHAETVRDVRKIFQQGQSKTELEAMKEQIHEKLRKHAQENSQQPDHYGNSGSFDRDYWQTVLEQLEVHLAKKALVEIHSQMLVRQLERLEQKRKELANMTPQDRQRRQQQQQQHSASNDTSAGHQEQKTETNEEEGEGFGDVEEHELAEDTGALSRPSKSYSWADKYRPRKPRYFNRVKTGYDWNKYNKTHYDRDNPPPKTVQGYKFNIFYPDLIDPSKTPQYELLKADSDDFCIIRFSAGPPYEDVAFKIINREWNKSRKHGFKSTFERGILSLYFNFKTSWYRR
ncbi:hypothetical protein ACA910_001735 [Epithemia clementina (nom. ined.)]